MQTLRSSKPFPLGLCACGCGQTIQRGKYAYILKRFVRGHQNRENQNGMWRGGMFINDKGYVEIRVDGKHVLEHRYIMEQHLGRPLTIEEDVHHINGNKGDNRLENLELIKHSLHSKLTRSGHNPVRPKIDMSNRFCMYCGSNKTGLNQGYADWARGPNGQWICRQCSTLEKYYHKKLHEQ